MSDITYLGWKGAREDEDHERTIGRHVYDRNAPHRVSRSITGGVLVVTLDYGIAECS